MEIAILRQELHQLLDESDEKLLRMMLAFAKAYHEHNKLYQFTNDEIKELDGLRAKRLSRESKSYTRQEAKKIILRKA